MACPIKKTFGLEFLVASILRKYFMVFEVEIVTNKSSSIF